MLFTTAAFALLFLPLVLIGFFLIGRRSQKGAAAWLCLASLFFYGWWMPVFTLLLVASISLNFMLGRAIVTRAAGVAPGAWLTLGVATNLLLLGYFKYANFSSTT